MGLGVGRHNLKTFGTTVYGLTHPNVTLEISNKVQYITDLSHETEVYDDVNTVYNKHQTYYAI